MRTFKLPGERHHPDTMQFSPDCRFLAIQAFGKVDVLDTLTGATRHVCPTAFCTQGTPGVGFTADSRSVVYFQRGSTSVNCVRICDLDTGHDRVLRQGKEVPWSSLGDIEISAVRSDGRLVFVAVNPEPRTVEIVALDPLSGEQKFAFARHRGYIRVLAISPDGTWVAGSTHKDLRVWGVGGDKHTNRATWHFGGRKSHYLDNLALSRDGTYLAAWTDSGRRWVRVWDVKAKKELDVKDLGAGGHGFAFAPDRPLLAFTKHTEDACEVVFWDAKSAAEVKRFDWGLGASEAITFSPDGLHCATASQTWVVIWDIDA